MTDEQQEEQEKLTRRERRAQGKTGSKDSESVKDRNQRLRAEAAAKRRATRDAERESAAAAGLDAGERVDDAIARGAHVTGTFVRDNFAWLQWIIVAGVAGAIAILVINYRREVDAEKRGHRIASALSGEYAKVASTEASAQTNLVDTRKEYATLQEKDQKALEGWKALTSSSDKSVALVAQLAVGNTLFDLGKYAEARAAFEKVEKDPKSASGLGVRARAVEGIGLAFEAESKYPEAKKAFERLGNLEGSEDLSKFHVARIAVLSGEREEARKILGPLDEKLSKDAGPEGPSDYLGAAVRDLLKTVDPTMAAKELAELKKQQEAEQQERFRKMIEEMQKKAGKGENPLLPGIPALPIGDEAPAESTEIPDADASAPQEGGEDPAADTPATQEAAPRAPASPAPQPQTPQPQKPQPQKPQPPQATSPKPASPAPQPQTPQPPAPEKTPAAQTAPPPAAPGPPSAPSSAPTPGPAPPAAPAE